MPILSVVLSQQDLARIDDLAKCAQRTRSDLVRAALRRVELIQPDLVVQPIECPCGEPTPEVAR